MTTIVNPSSTPSVVYNKEGRTIETLVATGSFSYASALQANGYAQTTILIVTQGSSNAAGVIMPSGSDVGDILEVYGQPSQTGNVLLYVASGETVDGASSISFNLNSSRAFVFRKDTATDWRIVSQP